MGWRVDAWMLSMPRAKLDRMRKYTNDEFKIAGDAGQPRIQTVELAGSRRR